MLAAGGGEEGERQRMFKRSGDGQPPFTEEQCANRPGQYSQHARDSSGHTSQQDAGSDNRRSTSRRPAVRSSRSHRRSSLSLSSVCLPQTASMSAKSLPPRCRCPYWNTSARLQTHDATVRHSDARKPILFSFFKPSFYSLFFSRLCDVIHPESRSFLIALVSV